MSVGFWQLLIVFIIFVLPPLWLYIINRDNNYKNLSKSSKVRLVGFWVRFGAGLTDAVIIFAAQYVITLILFSTFFTDAAGAIFIQALISWAYICIMQSSKRQATLGMMLLKFKICDHNLKRVGLGKITLRYFATSLSWLILFIGFFMIGWTKRKQGLHDIFAKTLHVEN